MTSQSVVSVGVDRGRAIVRLQRAHGNAINADLVDALLDAFGRLENDDGVRGVLLAGSGKLFCPGLDLQELVSYDRAAMAGLMRNFAEAVRKMFSFPKPLVGAAEGHALAGGCILLCTADRRILGEKAMVGLNEVRVGVPIPYGMSQMLRETIRAPHRVEVALEGRNFSGKAAVETGLVHEVLPPEGFEEAALARLEELAGKDATAFGVTKRYLRSAALDRMRAHDERRLDEFLDCWFAEGTRRRIEQLVDGLRNRERK